ncbi:hypothetical protein [Maritimibacter sp. HL-12]|uniref:hypothetical protein n=1 Tax=Maritimibacter sp. HL-12 TaxID=1162418 RepID=UPI000A0EFDBC|nr:hypothetical protein [Maritimibacter sp. HL-12]SMH36052.1 hypothetical protein SAMN05661107_0685 [Maritimibacter sp. HL-12]
MTDAKAKFQPGAILHETLVGAFRANGDNLNAWCKRNGIKVEVARNATFGQSRGPVGRAALEKMIDAAGREFVEQAYARRLLEHAAQFKGGK